MAPDFDRLARTRRLAALDTAPELPFRGQQKVLIERGHGGANRGAVDHHRRRPAL
jgi:hypothetical protein